MKKKKKKKKKKGDQAQRVANWNQRYPSGTSVILTDDFGVEHVTNTRSEAWLLGCGTPVVKVEGRAGGYLLDRIRPVKKLKLDFKCPSCGSNPDVDCICNMRNA